MTDDVRKLLGGYATGTLSDAEKKILFEAALHDDALFAVIADEQGLKDLLDDGAVRAQVLQAIENPRFSVLGALREWFESPKSKALTATGAVLLAVIGINQLRQERNEANLVTAELRRPAPVSPAVPPPPAAPAQAKPQRDPAPPMASVAEAPRRAANAASERIEVAEVRQAEKDEQTTMASAPPPPPVKPAARPAAAPPAEGEVPAPVSEPVMSARSGPGGAVGAASQGFRAGALQRAAGTSVTPLRYELLRRDATGTFEAVPADYLFSPGDLLRLRVTSPRNGAVGVSTNTTNPVVSETLIANVWTEVPRTGGIAITAGLARLTVAFTPSEAPNSNLMDGAITRAKRAAPAPVSLEIPIKQKDQ